MNRCTFCIFALAVTAAAQSGRKALVGGTLIDGFGGPPIRHSVILIEGDRIQAGASRIASAAAVR
jgi:hypothetical protein